MLTRADRIKGGLYGLLIGDALGVPYEFHVPANLPPREALDFEPPAGFNRSHRGTPPGTWSDDGAQALALLDSLLTCGTLDPDDFGARLVRWWHQGYATPDGRVFDIGNTTSDALARLEAGVAALAAGPVDELSNGNGSLMRVLPLALWHQGSDAELVRDARLQSRVTHGHARAQLACALYCLWARRVLEQARAPYDEAVETLSGLITDPSDMDELAEIVEPFLISGSGYVVDCLHSARWALHGVDYTDVVRRAVSLGLDTDTTAAVAGGIAGLRWGLSGLPERWLGGLRGRSWVEVLLERLLRERGAG